MDVVVVGSGIAGLAAASELVRAGLDVLVCEAAEEPGGVIRSVQRDGYCFEQGPNTFRVGAPFAAFLDRHGLGERLLAASPASRQRFLVQEGKLVPVPSDPLRLATTPLLSGRGKLRLIREPFVARGDPTGESVAGFASRRLGPEVCERLVGPFLTGIYAGDEARLGAEAVFPSLVEYERRHGSIVRGALSSAFSRGRERGRPGIYSGRQGIADLLAPLVAALGDRLRVSTRVEALAGDGAGWRVEIAGPEGQSSLSTRALILATPSASAARLLAPVEAEAGRLLEEIEYAPVASVALGVDPSSAREAVRGFGFLVPRDEGEALLGCLFMSQLFPGRAPEGRELLTCLLGGVRRPEVLDDDDDALAGRALDSVRRLLGLRGEEAVLGVARWARAVPQPDPAHPRRVQRLAALIADLPPLALAGSYLAGVSVSDSAGSGLRAASSVQRRLRA
ncbi:MAG: protoporphyrinogen oxidase [Myxococcota bacterium]